MIVECNVATPEWGRGEGERETETTEGGWDGKGNIPFPKCPEDRMPDMPGMRFEFHGELKKKGEEKEKRERERKWKRESDQSGTEINLDATRQKGGGKNKAQRPETPLESWRKSNGLPHN